MTLEPGVSAVSAGCGAGTLLRPRSTPVREYIDPTSHFCAPCAPDDHFLESVTGHMWSCRAQSAPECAKCARSGARAGLEGGPDVRDAAVQVFQGAGVVDHDVGYRQALVAGRLGGHSRAGLVCGHAPGGQALDLDLWGDVQHDDRAIAGSLNGGLFRGEHVVVDEGVDDRVELAAGRVVGEDDLRELRPV